MQPFQNTPYKFWTTVLVTLLRVKRRHAWNNAKSKLCCSNSDVPYLPAAWCCRILQLGQARVHCKSQVYQGGLWEEGEFLSPYSPSYLFLSGQLYVEEASGNLAEGSEICACKVGGELVCAFLEEVESKPCNTDNIYYRSGEYQWYVTHVLLQPCSTVLPGPQGGLSLLFWWLHLC